MHVQQVCNLASVLSVRSHIVDCFVLHADLRFLKSFASAHLYSYMIRV